MPADRAALRRRVPLVNRHDSPPIPGGLVLKLPDQFTPAHVGYRFGKAVIFEQVLDTEAFHAQHLVFVNQARGQFVQEILPAVSNPSVNTGYSSAGFLPVFRALLFAGKRTLRLSQLLFILGKELSIARLFTRREGDGIVQAQINPYRLRGNGQRLEVLFHQEGGEIAPSGISGDGDGGRPGALGQGRDQRIGNGSSIRARVNRSPSQVKAEVVYSADWRPRFFLNVG